MISVQTSASVAHLEPKNNVKIGEEVYLLSKKSNKLFKAKYEPSTDRIVHCKQLGQTEERFLITTTFENNLTLWEDYDEDFHAVGCYIAWDLEYISRNVSVTQNNVTQSKVLPVTTKEQMRFTQNDRINIFSGYLHIGVGFFQRYVDKDNLYLEVVLNEVFQENVNTLKKNNVNAETKRLTVGKKVKWPVCQVDLHEDTLELRRKRKKSSMTKCSNWIEKRDTKKVKMTTFDDQIKVCTCKMKCYETIKPDEQIAIREYYWNISSYEDKNKFLGIYLERVNKKSAQNLKNPKKQRIYTNQYYLPVNSLEGLQLVNVEDIDSKQKVCKTMFLETFGISDKKVSVVLSKKEILNYCHKHTGMKSDNILGSYDFRAITDRMKEHERCYRLSNAIDEPTDRIKSAPAHHTLTTCHIID